MRPVSAPLRGFWFEDREMTECMSVRSCACWLHETVGGTAALRADSRAVKAGDVFVALKGEKSDGLAYARAAAERGAAALLCEVRSDAEEKCAGLPFVQVENLHDRLGEIASLYYGSPSAAMHGAAITGTNGKTSTSHWTAALLTHLGMKTAAIGTVGTFLAGECIDSASLTTPDAATLQHTFKNILTAGAGAFALEASSIGLVRHRLSGTAIETAVFTNLTRDHLDYHKTFEAYEEAKALLFDWPTLKTAVINADDAAGRRFIAKMLARGLTTIATSLYEECRVPGCRMMTAEKLEHAPEGMHFWLRFNGAAYPVQSRVFGRFNVSNLLETAAVALSFGFSIEDVARGLELLEPPAGRLQTVTAPDAPLAVVDYAHTPDALEKVLGALRETAESRGGRLVCVFGAGGDRDAGKRPIMGETASKLADRTVVTSDNPRTEDPRAIAEAILSGVPGDRRGTVTLELDRRRAIVETLCAADARDVVLIAGKGHEDYQEINGVKHPFDDRLAAREAFGQRRARCAGESGRTPSA